MGMTISTIYSDGSSSPLCSVHPDGAVEDCDTCAPWLPATAWDPRHDD